MFQHILLPTDGSDPAMRAVARGVELAQRLGARVTVMTALEHFPAGIMASGYRPHDEPQEVPGLQAATYWLEQAEAVARAAGVPCERLLMREQKIVYRAILDAAQQSGADLIVMGTHGMGLMERLFVGSQTQRVLAHTTIPVLTLH
ncbi:MAG: universal stress protein [Burkholderiales bacterium]|nr:universal stress protein [Burkholderiales bacterium]